MRVLRARLEEEEDTAEEAAAEEEVPQVGEEEGRLQVPDRVGRHGTPNRVIRRLVASPAMGLGQNPATRPHQEDCLGMEVDKSRATHRRQRACQAQDLEALRLRVLAGLGGDPHQALIIIIIIMEPIPTLAQTEGYLEVPAPLTEPLPFQLE